MLTKIRLPSTPAQLAMVSHVLFWLATGVWLVAAAMNAIAGQPERTALDLTIAAIFALTQYASLRGRERLEARLAQAQAEAAMSQIAKTEFERQVADRQVSFHAHTVQERSH